MAAEKGMAKPLKVILIILGVIVALLIAIVVGLNIYVRVTYASFYDQAQREFDIPGVNSGFICQDLDYLEEDDAWLFSGYSTDKTISPLYRLNADGSSVRFYATYEDGTPYNGHGSAITTTDKYAFLACADGYLVFNADDMANAGDGDTVNAIDRIDLEFTPAFMNVENGTLYAGTFHLVPDYPAPEEHHLITPDGSENAGIVYAYPADASQPYGFSAQTLCVFSIPDGAQGICVLPNGDIVLSSSWGISSSHIRTYDVNISDIAGTFFADGQDVPLYFLDSSNLVRDVVAPPMSEGIENVDGLIYISEESASNKYIFGKLYGAGAVYAIPAE